MRARYDKKQEKEPSVGGDYRKKPPLDPHDSVPRHCYTVYANIANGYSSEIAGSHLTPRLFVLVNTKSRRTQRSAPIDCYTDALAVNLSLGSAGGIRREYKLR